MGPWAHGKVEEVKYPTDSVVNATEEAMRWFDYWLKGKDNGIMDEPPVRYYVMGDVSNTQAPGNEWRTALAWPVPAKPTSFFLKPGGALSEKMAVEPESADTYIYDPKNPGSDHRRRKPEHQEGPDGSARDRRSKRHLEVCRRPF